MSRKNGPSGRHYAMMYLSTQMTTMALEIKAHANTTLTDIGTGAL